MMPSQLEPLKVAMPADDDTPDEVLVTRSQRGDRIALGLLVRRHQRALFALCLRYVRDTDEAADLVQRSFVRAMAKLSDLRDAAVFRSWLLRIGAHLSLNHLRDNARFVSDEGEDERPSDPDRSLSVPVLERIEAAESSAALRDAVRTLPTKQRMTLELRIYEDLPFREIAAALDISEGAAKVNFHYAFASSGPRSVRSPTAPLDEGGDDEPGSRPDIALRAGPGSARRRGRSERRSSPGRASRVVRHLLPGADRVARCAADGRGVACGGTGPAAPGRLVLGRPRRANDVGRAS
jgi:RNA polymerase sigma-70 factor (ECF subfamily)